MKRRRVIQRRVVVFLLLLLVGGAIVNVAVAWGIQTRSAKSPRSVIRANWKQNGEKNWAVMLRHTGSCRVFTSDDPLFADAFLDGVTGRSTGKSDTSQIVELISLPSWSFPRYPDWQGAPPNQRMAVDLVVGWPFWSVRCRFTGGIGSPDVQIRGGIRLPPKVTSRGNATLYRQSALPLTPVWPGFAINTIFYAAILWVMFAFPFAMRRRRRIKRGLCPACAYPVGTSPVCTECGKPLKFRKCMGLPSPASPAS